MTDPIAPTGAVAIVVKGYPRLSETFIAQELLGLQHRAVPFHIYSLRHPTDATVHPVHHEITAPVTYLPEYAHHHPVTVIRAWAAARALPGYPAAAAAFRADLDRDRTRNRVRRFAQACVLATACPPGTPLIYAHFLHTPASVARYAAMMLERPFAHFRPRQGHLDHARVGKSAKSSPPALGSPPAPVAAPNTWPPSHRTRPRVHLHYHGLDLGRFPRRTGPSVPPRRHRPRKPRAHPLRRPPGAEEGLRRPPPTPWPSNRAIGPSTTSAAAPLGADLRAQAATPRHRRPRLPGTAPNPRTVSFPPSAPPTSSSSPAASPPTATATACPTSLVEAQKPTPRLRRHRCRRHPRTHRPRHQRRPGPRPRTPPPSPPPSPGSSPTPTAATATPPPDWHGSSATSPWTMASTPSPTSCAAPPGASPPRPPMRIAFYAPMKGPRPPGAVRATRTIARAFLAALAAAGHHVRVVSDFASRDGTGDPGRQRAIAAAGADNRHGPRRRSRWHRRPVVHLPPVPQGPRPPRPPPSAAPLAIPYVVAEASYAPKQAAGPWAVGHAAVADAPRARRRRHRPQTPTTCPASGRCSPTGRASPPCRPSSPRRPLPPPDPTARPPPRRPLAH